MLTCPYYSAAGICVRTCRPKLIYDHIGVPYIPLRRQNLLPVPWFLLPMLFLQVQCRSKTRKMVELSDRKLIRLLADWVHPFIPVSNPLNWINSSLHLKRRVSSIGEGSSFEGLLTSSTLHQKRFQSEIHWQHPLAMRILHTQKFRLGNHR